MAQRRMACNWVMIACLGLMPAAGGVAAEPLVQQQARLLADYQRTLSQIEQGPLRLFQLLVRFANHELATAELVRGRIYQERYPESLAAQLDAYQLRQFERFDRAATELNREALQRLREQQQLELRRYRDEQLMALTSAEVSQRDQQGQQLLDAILAQFDSDPRSVRRIQRKQRKLDSAMRSVATAYQRYDLSDHRLSARVDRFKDARLERITLVLAMLAEPAEQRIAAILNQVQSLEAAQRQLAPAR